MATTSAATVAAAQPPPRALGRETFVAFQSPPFRYLWLNTFAFNLNQGMQRFAFVWLALRLSDGSGAAGVVAFALGIPVFFLSLPAGVLSDRRDRRVLLFGSQALAAVVSVGVAVLIWSDAVTLWAIFLLAAGIGATVAVGQPVRSAILPTVVEREKLMNGVVLMTMGQNAAFIIGPAIGGVTIALFGIGAAFAVQAAIYALGFLALVPLRLSRPAATGKRDVFKELGEGFAFIRSHTAVRTLMFLVVMSSMIVIGAVTALVPLVAKEELGVDAFGASMLFALQGVFSLLGSIYIAGKTGMKRKGTVFLFGLMAGGLVLTGIGLSPWYGLTAIFMAMFGITGAVYMNMNQTLIQGNTPHEVMGRVMSIHTLGFMGLGPMGALVAGPVADVIGAPTTIAICGLATTALAVGTYAFEPVLRRMD